MTLYELGMFCDSYLRVLLDSIVLPAQALPSDYHPWTRGMPVHLLGSFFDYTCSVGASHVDYLVSKDGPMSWRATSWQWRASS